MKMALMSTGSRGKGSESTPVFWRQSLAGGFSRARRGCRYDTCFCLDQGAPVVVVVFVVVVVVLLVAVVFAVVIVVDVVFVVVAGGVEVSDDSSAIRPVIEI
jgi:hypothetical protein